MYVHVNLHFDWSFIHREASNQIQFTTTKVVKSVKDSWINMTIKDAVEYK